MIMITSGCFVPAVIALGVPRFIPPSGDKSTCLFNDPLVCSPTQGGNEGFVTLNFWRMFFVLPIAVAIIQSILLLSVFAYDTPKFYKQRGDWGKLQELMERIYRSDKIKERIDAI